MSPALEDTRLWLERAVIGLNLCPFAKAPHAKGRVRFVESRATDAESLLADLATELLALAEADPAVHETTLLVHPRAFAADFASYNDFLDVADAALEALDLVGTIQVASFHPDYRFEDADADDVTNATNRSPHPMLHLLREASVTAALGEDDEAAADESERIVLRNGQTLRALGEAGLRAVLAGEAPDTGSAGA